MNLQAALPTEDRRVTKATMGAARDSTVKTAVGRYIAGSEVSGRNSATGVQSSLGEVCMVRLFQDGKTRHISESVSIC